MFKIEQTANGKSKNGNDGKAADVQNRTPDWKET